MFKVPIEALETYEREHPGITKMAYSFENAILPPCTHCGSFDTADVQCGFVSITLALACITTKFHLLVSGPRPGRFFCNTCRQYFTPEDWPEPIHWKDLTHLD